MSSLTYQYRIYPFGEQAEVLERWLGACRRLYNAALEQRKLIHKMGGQIGYTEQQKQLTELRVAFPEYNEIPCHVLQNVLLRLDRAFDNFFRRCKERRAGKNVKPGFPHFKARDYYRSLTCPDRYKYVHDNHLCFPKMGKIRMELHRPLPDGAVIKTCTIVKKADGWYVAFSLEVPTSSVPQHAGAAVGIDVGLENFVALSTGEMIPAPKFLRKAEHRLQRAQRVLSRRQKGSKRRARQRDRLALLHLRVQRQRLDFCRKLASDLAHKYSLIAVEDLAIKNMVKHPYLSKAIMDAAWGLLIESLEHVVVKTGSRLVKVPAYGTTVKCSVCGRDVPKALSERWHFCPFCGTSMPRDTNSAINVLHLGQAMPEVTPEERRPSAFRYKRKARPLVEPGTVPENAYA